MVVTFIFFLFPVSLFIKLPKLKLLFHSEKFSVVWIVMYSQQSAGLTFTQPCNEFLFSFLVYPYLCNFNYFRSMFLGLKMIIFLSSYTMQYS